VLSCKAFYFTSIHRLQPTGPLTDIQLVFIDNTVTTLVYYLGKVVCLTSCETLCAFPEAFVVAGRNLF
jgi:hypothetical protein